MVLQGLNNNNSDLFDPRKMLDAKSSKCASHLQEGSAAHLAVSHRAYHLCFFLIFNGFNLYSHSLYHFAWSKWSSQHLIEKQVALYCFHMHPEPILAFSTFLTLLDYSDRHWGSLWWQKMLLTHFFSVRHQGKSLFLVPNCLNSPNIL